MNKIIELFIGIIGFIVVFCGVIVGLLVYDSFVWGYVVSIFYNWFIIPIWATAPIFTIWQWVGIMLFIVAISPKRTSISIKKEYKEEEWKPVIGAIMAPWVVLFFAWIIKLFM